MNNPEEVRKKLLRIIIITGFSALFIIILWSVVTETVLPLYKSRQFDELTYNVLGIPVILIGTGIFVYGGWVFYRDSRDLFYDPKLIDNTDLIRNKNAPKEKIKIARGENTKMLFSTWKKGSFLLLMGAGLIIAGGIIINLKKILE